MQKHEDQDRNILLACSDCGKEYVKSGDKVVTEQNSPDGVSKASDRNELLEKLRRLEELRRDVEGMKKSAASDYNDQLKDINNEIQDLLAVLKDTEPNQ